MARSKSWSILAQTEGIQANPLITPEKPTNAKQAKCPSPAETVDSSEDESPRPHQSKQRSFKSTPFIYKEEDIPDNVKNALMKISKYRNNKNSTLLSPSSEKKSINQPIFQSVYSDCESESTSKVSKHVSFDLPTAEEKKNNIDAKAADAKVEEDWLDKIYFTVNGLIPTVEEVVDKASSAMFCGTVEPPPEAESRKSFDFSPVEDPLPRITPKATVKEQLEIKRREQKQLEKLHENELIHMQISVKNIKPESSAKPLHETEQRVHTTITKAEEQTINSVTMLSVAPHAMSPKKSKRWANMLKGKAFSIKDIIPSSPIQKKHHKAAKSHKTGEDDLLLSSTTQKHSGLLLGENSSLSPQLPTSSIVSVYEGRTAIAQFKPEAAGAVMEMVDLIYAKNLRQKIQKDTNASNISVHKTAELEPNPGTTNTKGVPLATNHQEYNENPSFELDPDISGWWSMDNFQSFTPNFFRTSVTAEEYGTEVAYDFGIKESKAPRIDTSGSDLQKSHSNSARTFIEGKSKNENERFGENEYPLSRNLSVASSVKSKDSLLPDMSMIVTKSRIANDAKRVASENDGGTSPKSSLNRPSHAPTDAAKGFSDHEVQEFNNKKTAEDEVLETVSVKIQNDIAKTSFQNPSTTSGLDVKPDMNKKNDSKPQAKSIVCLDNGSSVEPPRDVSVENKSVQKKMITNCVDNAPKKSERSSMESKESETITPARVDLSNAKLSNFKAMKEKMKEDRQMQLIEKIIRKSQSSQKKSKNHLKGKKIESNESKISPNNIKEDVPVEKSNNLHVASDGINNQKSQVSAEHDDKSSPSLDVQKSGILSLASTIPAVARRVRFKDESKNHSEETKPVETLRTPTNRGASLEKSTNESTNMTNNDSGGSKENKLPEENVNTQTQDTPLEEKKPKDVDTSITEKKPKVVDTSTRENESRKSITPPPPPPPRRSVSIKDSIDIVNDPLSHGSSRDLGLAPIFKRPDQNMASSTVQNSLKMATQRSYNSPVTDTGNIRLKDAKYESPTPIISSARNRITRSREKRKNEQDEKSKDLKIEELKEEIMKRLMESLHDGLTQSPDIVKSPVVSQAAQFSTRTGDLSGIATPRMRSPRQTPSKINLDLSNSVKQERLKQAVVDSLMTSKLISDNPRATENSGKTAAVLRRITSQVVSRTN